MYKTGRNKGRCILAVEVVMGVFCVYCHRNQVLYPLVVTDLLGKYDVRASVKGGGLTGELKWLQDPGHSTKHMCWFFLQDMSEL